MIILKVEVPYLAWVLISDEYLALLFIKALYFIVMEVDYDTFS